MVAGELLEFRRPPGEGSWLVAVLERDHLIPYLEELQADSIQWLSMSG